MLKISNPEAQAKSLGRSKILFAVVDPAEISIRHSLLFKKVFDLTIVLTQRLSTMVSGEVKFFDSIDSAMAHGRFWDLVIVQSVGNFILEYRFLEELDHFCRANSDFFLLAFPASPRDEEGDGEMELERRMIIVNVDAWERLGYPGLEEGQPYPGPRNHRRGRRFLDTVMSKGLNFHTFPEALSKWSLYVRPECESSRLYEGLVKRDEALVSIAEQRRWINLSNPCSSIWIYNSEPYRFHVPLSDCDAYFGPAAGFKYLDILSHSPRAEFVFYDYNNESLEWIEALRCNWDGNDFVDYVHRQPESLREKFKYVKVSIEQNQMILFDEFGGKENFKRLWHLFKNAKVSFFRCDLFNACDVRELTSKTNARRPFFTTAIFFQLCLRWLC